MIYQKYIKRLIDIVLSATMILLLSPVFLVTALLVRIKLGAPIFFVQDRVGYKEKVFKLIKFRTMTNDKDENGELLPNEKRKTKFGNFLRKISLDEIPEMFNILKGDMSIIGPRPALWNQDDLVAERDKYGANDVMPGLTGWAQINGRDELEIPVKARLDGEYVRRLGFLFDCRSNRPRAAARLIRSACTLS